MTLAVELDDGTALGVEALRETVTRYSATDRVVLHLTQGEAQLTVGFRGEHGVCYWRERAAADLVSSGGDNVETIIYGLSEIAFPPGSEIEAAMVIDAAEEFASTGARPTCIVWSGYREATPLEDTGMSVAALQELLGTSGR
ncbi:Imm1 family immunity protein [Saccharopolyspora sp. 5N708]|uniref:Imm1 family immunity protein n=1 Tax=Saccharopolyspora sp. 5N708 TaxID=3457424 RepID=UPI003FD25450